MEINKENKHEGVAPGLEQGWGEQGAAWLAPPCSWGQLDRTPLQNLQGAGGPPYKPVAQAWRSLRYVKRKSEG